MTNGFLLRRYIARRNLSFISITMGLLLILTAPSVSFAEQQLPLSKSAAESAPTFVPAEGAGASANWSGYVASKRGVSYTGVEGSWVLSEVSASVSADMAANTTWVGIGGVRSQDLIQAGTQALVQDGSVSYEAWYELLPDFQTRIPLAVHAGDTIHVSLEEVSDGRWQLTFINATSGQKYQKTLLYDSSHSSAEWIEEMPVGVDGRRASYLPLTDFGTTQFLNATAVANGQVEDLTQLDADPLTMVTGRGDTLAEPSIIREDGSFSVARTDTPATNIERQPRAHVIRGESPGSYSVIQVILW